MAMLEYPDIAQCHFKPADAELIALYAGSQTERASYRSMAHIQTFQQYWEQVMEQGCVQPELALKVGR